MSPTPFLANHVRSLITDRVGSYGRTVVYRSSIGCVCDICGGPKSADFPHCRSCDATIQAAIRQGSDSDLADRVRLGYYAIEYDDQMYKVIHNYKINNDAAIEYRSTIKTLLLDPLLLHAQCLTMVAGESPTAWATVPSTETSERYGTTHPLNVIVQSILGTALPEIHLDATGRKERRFSNSLFTLAEKPSMQLLRHVLLIEDSWASGTTVQSAASALKRAGAGQVSVFCLARILDLRWCERMYGKAVADGFRRVPFNESACIWGRGPHPLGR